MNLTTLRDCLDTEKILMSCIPAEVQGDIVANLTWAVEEIARLQPLETAAIEMTKAIDALGALILDQEAYKGSSYMAYDRLENAATRLLERAREMQEKQREGEA